MGVSFKRHISHFGCVTMEISKPKTKGKKMSNLDLSSVSDEQLMAEMKRRKSRKEETGSSRFNTVSMEEAFKLARKWEVDRQFSIKFGYPNIYTNWIRWIEDNNLNMKPFTTWYDEDGKKMKHLPKLDEDGWCSAYATIVLYCDGEVIQNTVSCCGNQLFDVLYEHCR